MESDPNSLSAKAVVTLLGQAGQAVAVRVSGASMRPLIEDGNRVTVVKIHFHELRTGDVIAFSSGEKIIVHRIVHIKKHGAGVKICQKGDNSPKFSWIEESDILGRVADIANGKKIVLSGFKTKVLNRWIGSCGWMWGKLHILFSKSGGGRPGPGDDFFHSRLDKGFYKLLRSFVFLCAAAYTKH